MVAALWSNSNWDDTKDDKGHRKKAIDDLNESHREAVEAVEAAMSSRVIPEEDKLQDDNPFFAAADRGLSKVDAAVSRMKKSDQETEVEEINYMQGLDQE